DTVQGELEWSEIETVSERMVTLINDFFKSEMEINDKLVFIGEDVLSPYGGAFKVAKDLSSKFPNRVFTTPISEAAIVGISNGLALEGFKPFVEIMFGDFTTLAMDQILNHASKFYHMYNKQVFCPIVIRTPMGGGRGYGPTHSQTLDKFLIGIDNVTTIALNILINPANILKAIVREKHPVILIENKLDYGKTIAKNKIKNFKYSMTVADYPVVKISPTGISPNFTLVSYGGNVNTVLDAIETLFYEFELLGEVIILSRIHPIAKADYEVIFKSVARTKNMIVVEEGSGFAGFCSEIISQVAETIEEKVNVKRITSISVPIPSSIELEKKVLVSSNMIVNSIKNMLA
ncbi:MAG TPA: transketolase C-terminal domain-containing protein, partial [Aquella sp.]|nr:transketolase C-terminal domain-containing protein [Aquella sp.]